jgi:prevent-host-death family protein
MFDLCRTSHRMAAMQEIISIRDANEHLSRYLERVEQGAEIIITRRGKPIARMLPIESRPRLSDAQQAARERLRERMKRGYSLGGDRVDRETLHERGL